MFIFLNGIIDLKILEFQMKKYFSFSVVAAISMLATVANADAIDCYKKVTAGPTPLFTLENVGVMAAVTLCKGATSDAPIDCYKKVTAGPTPLFTSANEGVMAAVTLCQQ
jgi:hypothetical protein